MKKIFVLLLMLLGVPVFASSLNDFSILIPLPSPQDFPLLLAPQEVGAQGVVIPYEAYQSLPQLVVDADPRATYTNTLRLVGARLDPCFAGTPPQACRRQIRLIWQPVVRSASSTTTLDAAVHTFYDFDEPTWKIVIASWNRLSSGQPQDALQVHPILKRETLQGPFWKLLRTTLLQFCGKNTLSRITAMSLHGNDRIWTFQGFDIVQNRLRPMRIPRTDSEAQLVAQNIDVLNNFVGGTKPTPVPDADFFALIRQSENARTTWSEQRLKAVVAKAFEFENPTRNNADTLDCVACHTAESVRVWGQQTFPAWNWNQDFANRYPNPWFRPQVPTKPFRSNQFRAFGYFQAEPVISQRVFNETIEVGQRFQIFKRFRP